MPQSQIVKDRHGRKWTVSTVMVDEAEANDRLNWFQQMTPAERVLAVYESLESSLKAQGHDAVRGFRRVHRLVKCPWSEISGDRGSRAGSSRISEGDEGS